MRREEEDPKVEFTGTAGAPDRTTETHPAYAQIGASRGHGGSYVMYGSDFIHNNHITIRIHSSRLDRHLSKDWHHADVTPYIEVMLTEAQWATFVSSLNSGMGVPCTLTYRDRQQIPRISAPTQRVDQFTDEVRQDAREAIEALAKLKEQIKALPIAKKHKDALLNQHFQADRKLKDSIPFVADSFAKHVEKTTEKAKIEIHAHAHNVITRMGLQAIQEQMPFQLPETSGSQGRLLEGQHSRPESLPGAAQPVRDSDSTD